MPEAISIIDAVPRPLAAVRVTTVISRWPKQFGQSLDKVYKVVKAGHVRQTGHNIMVYRHGPDGLVDIECGVEVETKFDPVGEVAYCETPSGRAVTATHVGPYDKLGVSHDAIVRHASRNGYKTFGTCWEIYGDWEADPAKLRTGISISFADNTACR